MEPLEEKANVLVENVKAHTNPENRSLDIGIFVSQSLRGKEINLYEVYLLSGIKMEFTRLSYVQPAWFNRVRITILLELLNLRLLAAAFEEREFLKSLKDVRASRSKPFDNGPYHTEVFPYNKCKCEELLLQGKTLPRRNKKLCGSIENLLVELALILEE